MKTVKFFLGAIALAAVSMIAAPTVDAKDGGNRDENGKILRGGYITNGFWGNWFVSAGAGVNMFYDNSETATGLALDVNLGKWVTPCVGVRAGFNGLKGMDDKFGYVHGDVMWNISNAIGGYKESRFWDFVPYAHAGLMIDNPVAGKEFGAGAGLLNVLRLCKRLDLTLDVRGTMYRRQGPAGYVSGNIGLSVNLGKTDWTRASEYHNPADTDALAAAEASAAALAAANAALAADKKGLQDENAALAAKNKSLQDENAKLAKNQGLENVEPASFFFEIGQTKLSEKELEHLDFYINNVLPYVKNKKATVITGSADKKTGTARRNQQLCEKRAQYVKDLLNQKYGIDTADFVFNTNISAEGKAELQRAVIVSFE